MVSQAGCHPVPVTADGHCPGQSPDEEEEFGGAERQRRVEKQRQPAGPSWHELPDTPQAGRPSPEPPPCRRRGAAAPDSRRH